MLMDDFAYGFTHKVEMHRDDPFETGNTAYSALK